MGETLNPSRLRIEGPERLFLDSFHERTLERFFHREHLRLAWNIIREHGLDQGLSILAQGIKEFTEEQGTANQYHETLTMFWGRIIDHAIQERPDVQRFEEFLNAFPFLLEKDLPTRTGPARGFGAMQPDNPGSYRTSCPSQYRLRLALLILDARSR